MTHADETARTLQVPLSRPRRKLSRPPSIICSLVSPGLASASNPTPERPARLVCAPLRCRSSCNRRARRRHRGNHARQFDVTIAVPPDARLSFYKVGQAAVMKHVRIEGDAEFATTIAKLAEHLRWEPEEDLPRRDRRCARAPDRRGRTHGCTSRRCVRAAICSIPRRILARRKTSTRTPQRPRHIQYRTVAGPGCARARRKARRADRTKSRSPWRAASGAAAIPRGTRK